MGLKYGCAVEDVLTGLAIHCRGWRSIYFNPERKAFLGVAPTTLLQSLVQLKRWSEGDFQIFASRYCPFVHGYKKTPLMHQFAYCFYLLWAPTCLPTLYYVVVPSLCLLRGISLFPEVQNLLLEWNFAYILLIVAKLSCTNRFQIHGSYHLHLSSLSTAHIALEIFFGGGAHSKAGGMIKGCGCLKELVPFSLDSLTTS
jgi:hypothetical protein